VQLGVRLVQNDLLRETTTRRLPPFAEPCIIAFVSSLAGRIALVTGAARGIGRATAVRLARDGAKIAINYKGNAEAAAEAKRLVEEAGSAAALIQGDVSVDADAERVVKEALAFGNGRLDILVNNAGITRDNLLIRMSAEEWDAVLDLNLRGAFLITKAAMRPMMKQRGGRIVNVSSVAGIAGNAGQANYASAKAGLIGFTKTVAREMATRNITCNAVAPGFVPTDLTNALLKQMEETILKQIPLGRFGTVDDVAGAIAFLASDEAAYITGQVIVVDGGMVA
jgi:3-oxoacyl-[acyl-carrier protein] reductase